MGLATRHFECTGEELSFAESQAPSCTEPGSGTYSCTLCGESKAGTIPAKGHNWKNATCTSAKSCSDCGLTEGNPLSSTGEHTWDAGTVTKEPNCKDMGERLHTCIVCGETKTESVDKTDVHSFDNDEDLECNLCGYHRPSSGTQAPGSSAGDHSGENKDSDGGNGGIIVVIIVAVLAVIGGAVAFVVIKKNK